VEPVQETLLQHHVVMASQKFPVPRHQINSHLLGPRVIQDVALQGNSTKLLLRWVLEQHRQRRQFTQID
jgi:hypothetical protein